jgi:tetratricopeptide (TPR) repeat protein
LERQRRVFCSHRSRDNERVRAIAAQLAAAGIDPWVDDWEIRPGDDIVRKINDGLAACDAGLLFVSSSTLESPWVSAEVSAMVYQRIQEGRCLIPVMIDADAPLPPLLKPYARLGAGQVEALVDAIYGRSSKPVVAAPRAQVRERSFRVALRSLPEGLGIRTERDGEAVGPEATARLGAGFSYSYRDFLTSRPAGARASAGERAAQAQADLLRLGDAVGAAIFTPPIDSSLAALLGEARGRGESVRLSFETAEPPLLAIPFEAARLPGGLLPALEPGVRVIRRFTAAAPPPLTPLPGPLRILVAVGAPDEGRTSGAVLDSERELDTILNAVEEARRFGNAEVRILEVGHPGEIQKALEAQAFHVLYVSGHGTAGQIEMETEEGDPVAVRPEDLAGVIRAAERPLPLVFLSSCLSGAGGGELASFAQGLLAAGLPQVLAMQTSVSDWYATRLAGAFLQHLSRLEAPLASHALALARQEVEAERRKAAESGRQDASLVPEYATPSLFVAADEMPLLDRALPQEPLHRPPRPFAQGPVPLLGMDDLIGRRSELRAVLRVVRNDRRAVAAHGHKAGAVVFGMGGVGKSALAGRAMSRLAEEGWHVAAVGGSLSLGELARQAGTALAGGAEGALSTLAGRLRQPESDDQERLRDLRALLAQHPVLLVLDNFEDNLEPGGNTFRDPRLAQVLQELCAAAVAGKLLVTSRYPLPDLTPWLVPIALGPLSPAETRKLFLRLPALRDLAPPDQYMLLRTLGGHPRMLEYLDAILRQGAARLPDLARRLRENARKLGLAVEDLGGTLDEALRDALRIGAADILLDELLEIVSQGPGDREVLEQAAVFERPVELAGLAFALAGGEPQRGRERAVRAAVERLERTSLLTPAADGRVGVHRWTAEALKARSDPEVHRERCRRAGEYLAWRVANVSHALMDGIESVRLLLAATAFDRALKEAWSILSFMETYGQASDVVGFAGEILAVLPEAHYGYPALAGTAAAARWDLGDTEGALARMRAVTRLLETRALSEPARRDYQRDLAVSYNQTGDLHRALGQGREAQELYREALEILERLAQAEPGRADYQRNVSVSYNKMGDLYRALGQKQAAQELYRKAQEIRARLAQSEPDREDYQQDLAVSYERLGDEDAVLGNMKAAQESYRKALQIRERLAQSKPGRADYQRQLSICYQKMGDLHRALDQVESAQEFYRKALAIAERLAQSEPDRANYQRDLSVSYGVIGDLYLALGQREAAQEFLHKALQIQERLAQSEPTRADYQRDLSVSYNKLGDLHRALGEAEVAQEFYRKDLEIAERLAHSEPARADYQVDLAVSLSRSAEVDPARAEDSLRRAFQILNALRQAGALSPEQEGWIATIERQLHGT